MNWLSSLVQHYAGDKLVAPRDKCCGIIIHSSKSFLTKLKIEPISYKF